MRGESPRKRPVPTVRAIIQNEEGKVLFLKRADGDYGAGGWCLPGGKVEYGETVEEAVLKEVWEETHLKCRGLNFLFPQDSLPPEPGAMHCINFYFECQASGEPVLNAESDDWAWIGPSELDEFKTVFRNGEAVRQYWRMRAE
jgi:mutator protein MutT